MVAFRLNAAEVDVDVADGATLLSVLVHDLQVNGIKYGCGRSQCGSCTVLIDGEPVASCQTSISAAAGRSVETPAGLREGDEPGVLQRAFIAEQASQCGYCTAGIIMAAQALLDRNPDPSESDVRSALDDNLCRCGTQNRFVRAVLRAAREA